MDHITRKVRCLPRLPFLRAAGIVVLMLAATYVASAQTNTTDRDTASGIATGSSSCGDDLTMHFRRLKI